MNRRNFILKLGAGTVATVTLSVILKDLLLPENNAQEHNNKPKLKNDVIIKPYGKEYMAFSSGNSGSNQIIVNKNGLEIISMLDGHNTVEDIADAYSTKFKLTRTDELDSKIAFFISQVALVSFLQTPFYVNIVENYA
jgi:hypothetical protein